MSPTTAAGIEATSNVAHFGPERPDSAITSALGTDEDKSVFRLDRLRLGDGEPVAFDRTWMPVFYAQLLESHDLANQTIYSILENEYEIPIIRGKFRIEAINAPSDVAEALDVPSRRALLLIERTSYTDGGKIVYFQRRYYRSDRVAYELCLERNGQDEAAGNMPLQEFEPVFK